MSSWQQSKPYRKSAIEAITVLVFLGMCAVFSLIAACNKNPVKAPIALAPGFTNEYDQQAYATLYTAEQGINKAKEQFGGNPQAKTAINAAIKAYNDALAGYNVYHAAALNNGAADHSVLDNLLAVMLAAIAAQQRQFGIPPTPVSSNFGLQRLEAM